MRRNTKNSLSLLTWAIVTSLSPALSMASSSDLISDIVSDMDRFSQVATKTKQNELYQPYIISVFHGKELEELGISDLEEALELVPGVDMATDNMDYKTPIFRGSNPFAFGQTKLLIDGVLVNDLFVDGYTAYLNMPVEMIKRLEVVRGPGSKTDGYNAYAGSINIITYAEKIKGFDSEDKVVFKGGTDKYYMGGFVKSYQSGKLRLFTDFYYQEDDKMLPVGWDAASTGIYNFPHLAIDNTHLSRSGDAPVWLRNYSLGVLLEYGAFSIKAKKIHHKQGSAYGINTHLPNADDHTELPSCSLELGYKRNVGNVSLDIKGGVRFGAFASEAMLVPPGYQFPSLSDPIGTATTFTDGFYGIHEAKQRTTYQSSFFKYRGLQDHQITLGYSYANQETYSVTTMTTDRDSGTGLTDYSETYPFFNVNAKRRTMVFSLQDHYHYSDTISLLYGVNIEESSLNSTRTDPRVSIVYQPDPENIYKAIYSRSHRNPSWQEMYTVNNSARVGNPDLEPEEVDAFEAAYIRKFSSDSYLQANVFYLLNKDQIDKTNAQNEYRNAVDTDIYGLEFEYKGNITQNDRLYLNYSFVNGKDNNDASLSNVAKHLAKGYYIYDITPYVSLSGIAKYVGEKGRLSYDARTKVDDYMTLDAALRYENPADDYAVTLSVKNIFDENVLFPSEPMTYVGDYPQEGRTGMITFTKAF
jgi:iron complex outermembrane receptor protein